VPGISDGGLILRVGFSAVLTEKRAFEVGLGHIQPTRDLGDREIRIKGHRFRDRPRVRATGIEWHQDADSSPCRASSMIPGTSSPTADKSPRRPARAGTTPTTVHPLVATINHDVQTTESCMLGTGLNRPDQA
jgi:hypothetical protein